MKLKIMCVQELQSTLEQLTLIRVLGKYFFLLYIIIISSSSSITILISIREAIYYYDTYILHCFKISFIFIFGKQLTQLLHY